jgi:hypothetical protein
VIALKLLEENNNDEYICAFLQSPVNDLSHYCKLEFIIKRNSIFDFLDASFSERINGLKVDVKSVNNRKIKFLISLFVF